MSGPNSDSATLQANGMLALRTFAVSALACAVLLLCGYPRWSLICGVFSAMNLVIGLWNFGLPDLLAWPLAAAVVFAAVRIGISIQ